MDCAFGGDLISAGDANSLIALGVLARLHALVVLLDCAFGGDLISAGVTDLLIALGVLARLRALVVLLLVSLGEFSECVGGLLVVGVDRLGLVSVSAEVA